MSAAVSSVLRRQLSCAVPSEAAGFGLTVVLLCNN